MSCWRQHRAHDIFQGWVSSIRKLDVTWETNEGTHKWEQATLSANERKPKETKPEGKVRNQANSNHTTAFLNLPPGTMASSVHQSWKGLATGQPSVCPEAKLNFSFTSYFKGLLISRVRFFVFFFPSMFSTYHPLSDAGMFLRETWFNFR